MIFLIRCREGVNDSNDDDSNDDDDSDSDDDDDDDDDDEVVVVVINIFRSSSVKLCHRNNAYSSWQHNNWFTKDGFKFNLFSNILTYPLPSKSAIAFDIFGHVNQNNVGNGDCTTDCCCNGNTAADDDDDHDDVESCCGTTSFDFAWRRFAPPFNGYVWIATGSFNLFQAATLTKLLGKYPSCFCTTSSSTTDVDVDVDVDESMVEEWNDDENDDDDDDDGDNDEVENPYIGWTEHDK